MLRTMKTVLAWLGIASLVVGESLAAAQPRAGLQDYDGEAQVAPNLVVDVDRPRTTEERIWLGALAGSAVLFGGVGLYFHADARSLSDEVSAVGERTGRTYTQDVDDKRKRAITSGRIAVVGYGLGILSLAATVVYFARTDPGTEVLSIDPVASRPGWRWFVGLQEIGIARHF